ncbi:hypothetical protein Q0Z83_038440 [Actinoplanes sichuanensis]|nr:hypothetical protein Q0Z83_038440 [Actinoplanes sichuanensis]
MCRTVAPSPGGVFVPAMRCWITASSISSRTDVATTDQITAGLCTHRQAGSIPVPMLVAAPNAAVSRISTAAIAARTAPRPRWPGRLTSTPAGRCRGWQRPHRVGPSGNRG